MGTVDIFSEEVIAIIKMFVIILPFLFAAANSLPFQFSSFSKPSVRVPNPCNTQDGTQCIFPFTYLGVEYHKCTYAASPVPWCPPWWIATARWSPTSGGTAATLPSPLAQWSPSLFLLVLQKGDHKITCLVCFLSAILELPTPPAPPQERTWPGAPPTLPLLESIWRGIMDIVHPLVQGLRTIQQLLHLQQPPLLLHQVQQLQFQQLLH